MPLSNPPGIPVAEHPAVPIAKHLAVPIAKHLAVPIAEHLVVPVFPYLVVHIAEELAVPPILSSPSYSIGKSGILHVEDSAAISVEYSPSHFVRFIRYLRTVFFL